MARRDPRLGTGGALALLFVLAIDAIALTYLAAISGGAAAGLACVAAGAASRAVPVVVARLDARRSTGSGFGAWFVGLRLDGFGGCGRDVALGAIVAVGMAGGAALAIGGWRGGGSASFLAWDRPVATPGRWRRAGRLGRADVRRHARRVRVAGP